MNIWFMAFVRDSLCSRKCKLPANCCELKNVSVFQFSVFDCVRRWHGRSCWNNDMRKYLIKICETTKSSTGHWVVNQVIIINWPQNCILRRVSPSILLSQCLQFCDPGSLIFVSHCCRPLDGCRAQFDVRCQRLKMHFRVFSGARIMNEWF